MTTFITLDKSRIIIDDKVYVSAAHADALAKALEYLLDVTADEADEPDSKIFLAHAAARTEMYEYQKAEK